MIALVKPKKGKWRDVWSALCSESNAGKFDLRVRINGAVEVTAKGGQEPLVIYEE